MPYGFKNEQMAVDAAVCAGKIKNGYTTTELVAATFSRDQLKGETIPTGTVVFDTTTSQMKFFNGTAFVSLFDVVVYANAAAAVAAAGAAAGTVAYITDVGVIQSDGTNWEKQNNRQVYTLVHDFDQTTGGGAAVLDAIMMPMAGKLIAVSCVGHDITNTPDFMLYNLTQTQNMLASAVALAADFTPVAGTVHGTAANLLVAANDIIQLVEAGAGGDTCDGVRMTVVIEPTATITVT